MQIFLLNIMSQPSQSLLFTYFCIFIHTFFSILTFFETQMLPLEGRRLTYFFHISYSLMIKHRLLGVMITVPLFNGQKYPVPSRPLSRGPAVYLVELKQSPLFLVENILMVEEHYIQKQN